MIVMIVVILLLEEEKKKALEESVKLEESLESLGRILGRKKIIDQIYFLIKYYYEGLRKVSKKGKKKKKSKKKVKKK